MASAAAVSASNSSGATITEVVVQGIRRFGDVRRITFAPGYNVVHGLASSGKTTLHEVLLSLIFARPAEGEKESFASLLPQGKVACRAGMTLSLDGELWRVLKDYQQGVTTLSRFNAAEKRFDLVLSDVAAIQRWLVETAKLPAGPDVGTVVTLTRKEFPSVADGGTLLSHRRDGPDDAQFADRIRDLSLPERRELLAKFLDEYRRHADMRTTEFLQDGLRAKLFEVEAIQRKRAEVQKKLEEVDLEHGAASNLPKLPEGIDERVEAYVRQAKQREAELANLVPQRDETRSALQLMIPRPYDEKTFRAMKSPLDMVLEPLKRDYVLDGGIALLFAGIIAAFFGSAAMKVGALLAVGGIGVAIWRGVWVFYRSLESFQVVRKRLDQMEEQLRTMERKWDIETSVVRNLMKAYDVDDPREMREIEKKLEQGNQLRAELNAQLEGLTVGGRDASKEHARITKQMADLDLRLQDLSKDMSSDPKDLEPQIELLDRDVMRAEGKRPTPRAKLFQNADDAAGSEDGADGRNAANRLLDAWCSARKAELTRLLRAITEPYSRNLRALSGGRLSEATFDAEGNITLRQENRGAIAWDSLDAPARDAAYLALRMTLFQLDSKGNGRALIFLDDPFEFEEPRLQAISRALRALAPNAQVVHLTSRPVHLRLADAQVEI